MHPNVIRWVSGVLLAVGFAALLITGGHLVADAAWDQVPAVGLMAAFLVAGGLGVRAVPGHPGLLQLSAVGSLHLTAAAISVWASGTGAAAWVAVLMAQALFLAGFVALAMLLALYPSGLVRTPLHRWFVVAASAVLLVVVLHQTFLAAQLDNPVDGPAVPSPLPWAHSSFPALPVVVALVPAGVLVLVLTARLLEGPERQAVRWARLAGIAVLLMLVATPLADVLLPAVVWDIVFPVTVGAAVFLLLAGQVRFRLLDVDLFAARTVARALVVLLVLGLYAALAGEVATTPLAVALTALAALTGVPLVRWLEERVDAVLSGGRVRRSELARRLDEVSATDDRSVVRQRICDVVREGLDVAWVRLAQSTMPTPDDAEVVVPLETANVTVGRLECGPRRGGWSPRDVAMLQGKAGHLALALREADLSRELAARVEELTASRASLAYAEDAVRRRIERDLHDGVQQQLVALLLQLSVARDQGPPEAASPIQTAVDLAQTALAELRQIVSGIHPPILVDQGLVAAVQARAAMMPLHVAVDVDPRVAGSRFSHEVEGTAYYLVSEALGNVMKHSGSDRARVIVAPTAEDHLRVAVADEGRGTADADGSGLAGLRARVEAVGGTFAVHATPGVGTTLVAAFPTSAPARVDA